MNGRVRRTLAVAAAAISCGCGIFGPSESVDGRWEGSTRPSAAAPSSTVYLNLRQNDELITGTACWPRRYIATVRSKYPNVSYTATEPSVRWAGKLEKSGDIVSTIISDIERFRRTDTQPAECP